MEYDYSTDAKIRALELHKNQKYGIYNYSFHLEQVVSRVELAIKNDLKLLSNREIISAAWLHDTVEDCEITIEEISRWHGQSVASMVELVTDPKGKTRKERKHSLYEKFSRKENGLEKLGASIIKLSDRYCNQFSSIIFNDRNKMNMYRIEEHDFIKVFAYDQARIHKGVECLVRDLKRQNELITHILDT